MLAIALIVGTTCLASAPAWATEEGDSAAAPATPSISGWIEEFVEWVESVMAPTTNDGETGQQMDPDG